MKKPANFGNDANPEKFAVNYEIFIPFKDRHGKKAYTFARQQSPLAGILIPLFRHALKVVCLNVQSQDIKLAKVSPPDL